MLTGFDIICVSTSDWDRPWGSRQQIMSRLALKNRVLFVECQLSFLHLFKYPHFLKREFNPRIRHPANGLILYRPWPGLPFGDYNEIINFLNSCLLLWQLRKVIKKYKFRRVILWAFNPIAYFLFGKLGESLSLYHCIDFFRSEKKSSLRKKYISTIEDRLCRDSDLVLVSGKEIFRDRIRLNNNTYLIPSATNEVFLNTEIPKEIPADTKNMPHPLLGFIGTMDERLDLELLDFIVDNNPKWAIIFIGIKRKNRIIRHLERKNNIYLLGWRNNDLLAGYIKSFDVCIIPYKINDFTKGISPVKLYDYLAFGKPVVSTNLPDLGDLNSSKLISVAKDKDEFCRQISSYLVFDDPDTQTRRIEFSRNNTWTHRVDDISGIIGKQLNPGN